MRTVRITFSVPRPRGHYLAKSVCGVSPGIHGRCISVTYPRNSKTRSDLQSWSKRDMCIFQQSPSPPPPLDSVGCYRRKTLKKSFKVYELQLSVRGWVGGGNGRQSCWKLNLFSNTCTSVLNPVFSCFPCTTVSYSDFLTFFKNLPNKLA